MARIHGVPTFLAKEAEYRQRATIGSTSASTLLDVPVPRFEGDEPRPPGSSTSVIADVPLPSLSGGTSGQVPPWRGSTGTARPSDPSREPRPWSRGNDRTWQPRRAQGAQHGQAMSGQYEWVWNSWRETEGTSYSPASDERWRRRGDQRGKGSQSWWDSSTGRWHYK